jgi:hypothetical protein
MLSNRYSIMKLHLDQQLKTCGLYCKNITITNETSGVVRVMIVTFHVVLAPTVVILRTLKVSFILLENIYSAGVTNNDCHLQSSYFNSTGNRAL